MTKYNENNFFAETVAVFDICDKPEGDPDFVSGSGSAYWYVNGGVIRCSDHWGYGIASCKWWLRDLNMRYAESVEMIDLLDAYGTLDVCAFCKFEDFRNRDEFEVEFSARKREVKFKVNPFFGG